MGTPGPNCPGGLIKDDGSAETGWGWVPTAIRGQYLQELNSGELPTRFLDRICICWLRTRQDADLDFDIVIYGQQADLPAAVPFAVVPAQVRGLPQGVPNATFFEFALPNIEVPAGTFYIGPRWNPSLDQFFFVCADTTATTPPTNLWFIDDRAEGWDNTFTTTDPIFANHRAALIRPVAGSRIALDVPVGATALAILILALATAGLLRLWKL